MNGTDVRPVKPEKTRGLQISVEPHLRALSDRYAARGLRQSVRASAAKQIEKEEKTRELAPDAYRLSLLSDAAISGRYRLGKAQMGSADLVRYFCETRARRIKEIDFSKEADKEEALLCDECETPSAPTQSRALVAVEHLRSLPQKAGERLKEAMPRWFNTAKPDTSRENRRFPLSAFAAIGAVAVSLMLIVASSVLLTRAESKNNSLRLQVADLTGEVAELRSDLDVRHDLLEIRRIAMEEYGMVEENYVKMQYVTLENEDSVEVFEDERDKEVGLSAILSAILN